MGNLSSSDPNHQRTSTFALRGSKDMLGWQLEHPLIRWVLGPQTQLSNLRLFDSCQLSSLGSETSFSS